MIDHIHLLTDQPKPPSDVLRIIKGITARRVIDYLKENDYTSSLEKLRHEVRNRNHRYSLWQTEKNVLPIFSEGMFMQKVNYIHNNPVCAGLVEKRGLSLFERAEMAAVSYRYRTVVDGHRSHRLAKFSLGAQPNQKRERHPSGAKPRLTSGGKAGTLPVDLGQHQTCYPCRHTKQTNGYQTPSTLQS